MKFGRLLSACLVINLTINAADKLVIKLDDPILGVIDGIKGFMDGNTIHKMLFLGQELNQFMYGVINLNDKGSNKEGNNNKENRIPQYAFKGKFYTLEQLVGVEEEIERLKDKDSKQYQEDKPEIAKTLEELKKDFLGFTSKVSKDAKGSAEQTYRLIDNFMSKYGDCSLRYWRIDKDEVKSVHKRVTSIKLCFNMSHDLYYFLKAMIASCPKALEMYKNSQKQSINRSDNLNVG